MEPAFWKQAWAEGRTRFHEGTANAHLVENLGKLRGRVLVPLCGKAEDLAYLAANGHDVIGVELVEDAVKQFFAEHSITPTTEDLGAHRAYRHANITLVAGDWFGVTREMIGHVDSVYDRAALVALPPELRTRYIAHLRALVGAGTPGLLVAIDYDQARFAGPPFAVPDAEVRAHYASVTQLGEVEPYGRIGEANVGAVERTYATTL